MKVILTQKERLTENFNNIEIGLVLPKLSSVATMMYRVKHKTIPSEPKSCKDLDLSNEFLNTINGNSFLLADEGTDDRILVFGTKDFFIKMCSTENLYSDGTFNSVPKIFMQLYTFHGFYKGEMIPFIFALLPNKTNQTYLRLFRLIQNKAIEFNTVFAPKKFLIDFELAAKMAISSLFPHSEIKGCLFHFVQSIIRNLQKLRLMKLYKTDKDFKTLVKRLASLTFMPIDKVDDAWELIIAQLSIQDGSRIKDFVEYFLHNWMFDENKFPINMWNHHMNYGPRTNNHLEGWHHTLNRKCGSPHKNIYEFIRILKEEQQKFEAKILMLDASKSPTKPKKKYKLNNESIIRLTNQYLEGSTTTLQFLDAISHTIIN